MVNDLSSADIRLLQSLLSKKSESEIAHILGLPVQQVTETINEQPAKFKRPARLPSKKKNSMIIQTKARKRAVQPEHGKKEPNNKQAKKQQPSPAPDVQKKVHEKKIAVKASEQRRARDKEKWFGRRSFKSKQNVTAGLVAVRIDHKTIIYVKPGTEQAEIAKYNQRHNK